MARILIIDDEKEVLNVLQRFLGKQGYEVAVDQEWESGFQKFLDESFDLVILDVHMPGKDGFQLARMIKEARPDQHVMMITGLGAGDVYGYYKNAGIDVDDILYKPFSFDKIQAIIDNVLRQK